MTPPAKPRIHIVDDDESMRTALARLLAAAGYAVQTHASAGDFLIAELDAPPDCLLLDIQMPGPSGLELQAALRRRGSRVPVVFLSAHADVPSSVRAMKAGASDFLCKPVGQQALLAAVEAALSLHHAPDEAPDEPGAPLLNEREQRVLRGIVAGRLNKQIAEELQLSERTIKSCRADLMRKFGAGSLAELVRLSAQHVGPQQRRG